MDRFYLIRDIVDNCIEDITVDEIKDLAQIKKSEYTHSYGVASIAQILANIRGLNIEIASIIGCLHDIGRIKYNILEDSHGQVGAKEAQKILSDTRLFTINEINTICSAIEEHTNKSTIGTDYEELIKDADVMDKYLCGQRKIDNYYRKKRIENVKKELNLK
ncbi:HD domain-containing protein [Romboutsia sp.]|uniref:HD domain-containing protein n=1 Tax=Romboutsia sp. TaxID=1965302 RepID=UPI003F3A4F34